MTKETGVLSTSQKYKYYESVYISMAASAGAQFNKLATLYLSPTLRNLPPDSGRAELEVRCAHDERSRVASQGA